MDFEKRYACLIDADNISDKYIKVILDELANYGVATYKRIYGDWTSPSQGKWKAVLLENSITPVQQYSYTIGKNATDSAMIIDAMDILYSGNVEGFCLVTSDSDFTKLAARLRESGMDVIGMGEKKTPRPFISACNQFKYLDILSKANSNTGNEKVPQQVVEDEDYKVLIKTLKVLVEENSDEDGWLFAGDLGNMLQKRLPDFDVRNYGYRKLTPFLKSLGDFKVKTERGPGGKGNLMYVKENE